MATVGIGTRIGRYHIKGLIGRGGMGVVYLAQHERLERDVAIKVLAPELSSDRVFRERFIRESKIAASLHHPNIVTIYEADEAKGVLYLAMQFVQGIDLKTLIQRDGALAPERAVRLLSQVASALDAAHDRGLIHRDVKPANILIGTEGDAEHAHLTDFGLVKTMTGQTSLTGAGEFLGTPDYMAPEQIRGDPVDRRTDVYSLGCVFFECLTGEVPFQKQADVAAVYAVYAHLEEPPPAPSSRRAGVPPELDLVVLKALAKEPDYRPSTCGQMAAEAERAIETRGRTGSWRGWAARRRARRAARPRRRDGRRAVLAAAGVVLLSSVVVVALLAIPRGTKLSPDALLRANPRSLDQWLQAQRGHLVVLSFWGSWCPPCRPEARVLGKAWKFYRGLGVRFLGINEKDHPAAAAAFRRRYGLTYLDIVDPPSTAGEGLGQIAKRYKIIGIPVTLILDQRGRLRREFAGPQPASSLDSQLNGVLRALLSSVPH